MKTVVIYESVYGNTEHVAEEFASVARRHGDVDLVRAEEADAGSLVGADLLLIGGPTHLHGLSTRMSRQSGAVARDDADTREATIRRGRTSPDPGCATGSGPWGASRAWRPRRSTPVSRARSC